MSALALPTRSRDVRRIEDCRKIRSPNPEGRKRQAVSASQSSFVQPSVVVNIVASFLRARAQDGTLQEIPSWRRPRRLLTCSRLARSLPPARRRRFRLRLSMPAALSSLMAA